jgi:hypothetical protein
MTNSECARNPGEAYLIDQVVFPDSRGRTLAQQAFLSGDRYGFRLLTRKFRANPRLPISLETATVDRPKNMYCAVAYIRHRDLWFA